MKFCTNCGNQMPEESVFCTQCGTRFEVGATQPQATTPPAPPEQPTQPPVQPTQPPIQPTQAPVPPVPPPPPQMPPQATGGMNFDFNTNTATPTTKAFYEYKVLSQKDKWFSGKFDPSILEQAINAYAQQGWRVISCATADIAAFGSTRQEFITILEREK